METNTIKNISLKFFRPESKLLINKKSPIKKVKASKKAKTKVEKSLKE